MQPNIIVIDDFYSNPDLVRNFALTQEFNVRGNYSGVRTTSFLTEDVKEIIQKIIIGHSGKITEWFSQDGFSGSFHLDTASDQRFISTDQLNTWAGVCYLTPNAPLSGGIGIYRHRSTGEYVPTTNSYESQDITKWELVDNIGNKYNRLVLYRSDKFHANMDYFGSTSHDGRLFQVFYFNTEF